MLRPSTKFVPPIAEGHGAGGRKGGLTVTDAVLCKSPWPESQGPVRNAVERLEEYRSSGCTHIHAEIVGAKNRLGTGAPCLRKIAAALQTK